MPGYGFPEKSPKEVSSLLQTEGKQLLQFHQEVLIDSVKKPI